MVPKLPRELRDYIYQALMGDVDYRLTIEDPNCWFFGPTSYLPHRSDFQAPNCPYTIDPDFVHPTFALEMSESVHETAIIRFECASEMKSLLGCDLSAPCAKLANKQSSINRIDWIDWSWQSIQSKF